MTGIEEHGIRLHEHDIDHLVQGQPVFKGIEDEMLVELYPEANNRYIHSEEVRELIEKWRYQVNINIIEDLEELIEDD